MQTKSKQSIEQSLLGIPYMLKYKTYKVRFYLSFFFYLLYLSNVQLIKLYLHKVINEIPLNIWLQWIPHIISNIINNQFPYQEEFSSLFTKLIKNYPQVTFYKLMGLWDQFENPHVQRLAKQQGIVKGVHESSDFINITFKLTGFYQQLAASQKENPNYHNIVHFNRLKKIQIQLWQVEGQDGFQKIK